MAHRPSRALAGRGPRDCDSQRSQRLILESFLWAVALACANLRDFVLGRCATTAKVNGLLTLDLGFGHLRCDAREKRVNRIAWKNALLNLPGFITDELAHESLHALICFPTPEPATCKKVWHLVSLG
eukprot:4012732-Amphidinium_carterae.2